ncbi:uncharacterized protein mtg isoform X2 [Fopius arisanus]|uniref:Uncharacterized protein mtg isoform X2 n=1 Tax=Fopius arisanus TaxID=64838 RepID=A0A9R1THS1_9HYME|nr:PREDICTED: uncharacterized protein LOC105270545 isoform X2 [Fopius arisanus]
MKFITTTFLLLVTGFSVGDELGFRESLSNLEASKRRSVHAGQANFIGITNGGSPSADTRQISQNSRVVPPFKPLPPGASRPMAPQPEHQRLVVQHNTTALKTIPAPSLAPLQDPAVHHQQMLMQQKISMQQQRIQQEINNRQQQRLQQEALALQILKEQKQQQEAANKQKLMQQRQSVNLQTKRIQMPQGMISVGNSPVYTPAINIATGISPSEAAVIGKITKMQPIPGILIRDTNLPAFVTMPPSSAQLTNRLSNSQTLLVDSVNEVPKDDFNQLPLPTEEMAATVNLMTLQSLNPGASPENSQLLKQQNEKRQTFDQQSWPGLGPIQEMGTSLKALSEASNITLEALEAAILLRQKQLMEKHQGPTTAPTTTTTSTHSPVKTNYNNAGTTKVMNAPREYYPMGYDKNFDDHFASRVDLPDTSFYCGDQKHFPGLYADEDLGCMVFHVCALIDEGLIMKSFLCPESTLFDQTILKCNWSFYVDCKNSRNLYDSNIPISKSYQLMKALAFFSAYKNNDNSTAPADDSES